MRRKILRVTLNLITDMLQQDNEIRAKCVEGLSKDAEIVDIKYTGDGDALIYIHSNEFEDNEEGSRFPFMECKFEKLDK